MTTNTEKFWYFVALAVSSPINVLGLFLLLLVTVILTYAQFNKKNKIDLVYLLIDPTLGKVTLAKFGGFGAFVASTWVFIELPVSGHFDAGYATMYTLTWAGVKVASDFAQTREIKRDNGNGGDDIVSTTARKVTMHPEASIDPDEARPVR